jgi:hypothetical protein
VISNDGRGGRRYLPHAFTEYGAIMAATVLNSKRAIETSIFVVLAFVRMRQAMVANREIAAKLTEIEGRLEGHDEDIQAVIEAIRELMAPPPRNGRKIGFQPASVGANPKSSLHVAKLRSARVPLLAN